MKAVSVSLMVLMSVAGFGQIDPNRITKEKIKYFPENIVVTFLGKGNMQTITEKNCDDTDAESRKLVIKTKKYSLEILSYSVYYKGIGGSLHDFCFNKTTSLTDLIVNFISDPPPKNAYIFVDNIRVKNELGEYFLKPIQLKSDLPQ